MATQRGHRRPEAIERGLAYSQAGGTGYFVPGLRDLALIADICAAVPLPVNAMAVGTRPNLAQLAAAGVGRISHGPGPFRSACHDLGERYKKDVLLR
ncbi:MAG: isocitrate lyase/phosphoenolpyruvate mutase family protein [Granulosicoccaceae bacterium]